MKLLCSLGLESSGPARRTLVWANARLAPQSLGLVAHRWVCGSCAMAVGRRMTQADLSPQNYLENKKKKKTISGLILTVLLGRITPRWLIWAKRQIRIRLHERGKKITKYANGKEQNLILVDHIHPNYIQQGISSFSFTQKIILCPLKHEAIILNKMQLKHIKSKVYLSK